MHPIDTWHRTYPATLPLLGGCVAAMGNFDGVHAGHQHLLRHAHQVAVQHNLPLVVLTFWPHPRTVLRPAEAFSTLQPLPSRIANLHACGTAGVAVVPFTPTRTQQPAEHFMQDVLVNWLHAKAVVVGENFRFGHKAQGTPALLQACPSFSTHVVPLLHDAVGPLSSTRLRAAQNLT